MFAIALAFLCLAVVHCQEATHPTHTKHPHTHHPHSHATHTQGPHVHPTHAPITDHKFDSANPVFFLDLQHHLLVMKTKSGCYGSNLNAEHAKEAQTADGILKLERSLLNQVTHATSFTAYHGHNMKAEIQTACPMVLHPHHPHPSPHPTH